MRRKPHSYNIVAKSVSHMRRVKNVPIIYLIYLKILKTELKNYITILDSKRLKGHSVPVILTDHLMAYECIFVFLGFFHTVLSQF